MSRMKPETQEKNHAEFTALVALCNTIGVNGSTPWKWAGYADPAATKTMHENGTPPTNTKVENLRVRLNEELASLMRSTGQPKLEGLEGPVSPEAVQVATPTGSEAPQGAQSQVAAAAALYVEELSAWRESLPGMLRGPIDMQIQSVNRFADGL